MGPDCAEGGRGASGLPEGWNRLAMEPWGHVGVRERLCGWPGQKPAPSQEGSGSQGNQEGPGVGASGGLLPPSKWAP